MKRNATTSRISVSWEKPERTRPFSLAPISLIRFVLLSCVMTATAPPVFAEEYAERPEWGEVFRAHNAEGTIAILDARDGKHSGYVFNGERAGKRFIPASTYKIPHALIALDTGVVKDEFQVFPWDGTKRMVDAWNQDQDLRSSMRNSAVWVYQQFAEKIPENQAADYLHKMQYGNADPTGGKDGYWLDGNLAISALEQIAFLKRLHRNELPIRLEHQRLVKDILVVEAGRDWILRAKTGWDGKLGWWVGWVEWPSGPVFFALNIDTPHRMEDLPKRESITRDILKSLQALPENK